MREEPDRDAPRVSELTWDEPVRLVTDMRPADRWLLVYGAHYDQPGWVEQQHLQPGNDPDVDAWLREAAAPYKGCPLDIARSLFLEHRAPYLWGGMTPAGVDCSGLVHMSYRLAEGRLIPRDAQPQEHYGTAIPWQELRPADLISYSPADPRKARTATHDAFYTGDGRILHSTGRKDANGRKLGVIEEPEPDYLKAMRRLAFRI